MDINKIVQEITAEVSAQLASQPDSPIPKREIQAYEVPSHLEHSLLVTNITKEKIQEECSNARRYCIGAVCVAPYYVGAAAEALRGSNVGVCAAIGFPYAMITPEAKLVEVKECIKDGATELDVALNVSAIMSGDMGAARRDLEQILEAALGKATVKAVFEHSIYTAEQKVNVLNMIKSLGSPYIKIQNVLSGQPAEVSQINFVKEIVGRNVKIKIDGGVKTLAKAEELLSAGADRIGLTATIQVAKEALAQV